MSSEGDLATRPGATDLKVDDDDGDAGEVEGGIKQQFWANAQLTKATK